MKTPLFYENTYNCSISDEIYRILQPLSFFIICRIKKLILLSLDGKGLW
ncbi:MAG: hypothetical protein JETT_0447 [Candidatus Jettenia ecosi]|uniref:Uncharacterized protein n=1 Tax=Candidatus Jettenia ecosi TaxID=2494326 RepID=A0A533QET8_9BACT|nr:MAG: hypothetical protein JETT_0447 [Candidatus Jettenia ecosi]